MATLMDRITTKKSWLEGASDEAIEYYHFVAERITSNSLISTEEADSRVVDMLHLASMSGKPEAIELMRIILADR